MSPSGVRFGLGSLIFTEMDEKTCDACSALTSPVTDPERRVPVIEFFVLQTTPFCNCNKEVDRLVLKFFSCPVADFEFQRRLSTLRLLSKRRLVPTACNLLSIRQFRGKNDWDCYVFYVVFLFLRDKSMSVTNACNVV